ncbi:mobilization protein (plasmid) [Rhizobium grahamii CCGE 502]|uniref:Mobilization protein n=1 Tax=Rhizobium grahamii CCGE 502 TaxID=990285 RepID=S3HKY2_9HYPH|nr:mobilization protein [Rhizobium grahamii CCGE 502]
MLTIDGRAVDGACGCSIRDTSVAHVRQATSAAGALRQRKDRVVHARFAASEWVTAQRAARNAGMTLSAFMRSLTLHGADIMPLLADEDRAVFELLHNDLRAIDVNLNDLVRLSRQHNVSADSAAVLRELQLVLAGLMLELRRVAARRGRKLREHG